MTVSLGAQPRIPVVLLEVASESALWCLDGAAALQVLLLRSLTLDM